MLKARNLLKQVEISTESAFGSVETDLSYKPEIYFRAGWNSGARSELERESFAPAYVRLFLLARSPYSPPLHPTAGEAQGSAVPRMIAPGTPMFVGAGLGIRLVHQTDNTDTKPALTLIDGEGAGFETGSIV